VQFSYELVFIGGVHHWDENGLANPADEPPEIQAIHNAEIEFVRAWLKDFKPAGAAVQGAWLSSDDQVAITIRT
jgi:hypothetical protein